MTNSCEKKIKHGDVKAVYQLGLWQQWPLLAHFLLACRDVCLLNVGIKHDFKVSQGLCAYKHEGPSGIPRTQLKKKKKRPSVKAHTAIPVEGAAGDPRGSLAS